MLLLNIITVRCYIGNLENSDTENSELEDDSTNSNNTQRDATASYLVPPERFNRAVHLANLMRAGNINELDSNSIMKEKKLKGDINNTTSSNNIITTRDNNTEEKL